MMKKILIIGTIVSSVAFAKGLDTNNNSMKMKTNNQTQISNKFANLTEDQKKELLILKEKHQKAMAPLKLNVQEKDLAIKKEMLADKPNWTKIETLTKEKAGIKSQIQIASLKNQTEMKEKFGMEFGNSFGKGQKGKGFNK